MDRLLEHSTGEIISEYLKENGLTAADVAAKAGVTLKSVYSLFSDEVKLNPVVADAIEQLLPGLTADFLSQYDAKYQLQKSRLTGGMKSSDLSGLLEYYDLKRFFPQDKMCQIRLFNDGVAAYGRDNFLSKRVESSHVSSALFSRTATYDEEKSKMWLYSARANYLAVSEPIRFDRQAFDKMRPLLPSICATTSLAPTLANMKRFCEKCGINFHLQPNYPGSRVCGATMMDEDGYIYLFLSNLFNSIESLWLAFVHECFHIGNEDYDHIEYNEAKPDSDVEAGVDEGVKALFINDNYEPGFLVNSDEDLKRLAKPGAPLPLVARIYQSLSRDYGNKKLVKYHHPITEGSWQRN